MSRRARARIALALSGACVVLLAAAALVIGSLHERMSDLDPWPSGHVDADGASADGTGVDSEGFPAVDWDYWQDVNPDVIGWITIPGTPVNYPVVQAPADDPDYYLTHDVYGEANYMGCPYLDAGCAEGGLLGSKNAVIFGHNLGFGDTSMFNAVASYIDGGFARAHREVLLQTPGGRTTCRVAAADCIGGWQAQKRLEFADEADYASWLEERYGASAMKIEPLDESKGVVTLCTCSYNYWSENERTVVYCINDALDGLGADSAD